MKFVKRTGKLFCTISELLKRIYRQVLGFGFILPVNIKESSALFIGFTPFSISGNGSISLLSRLSAIKSVFLFSSFRFTDPAAFSKNRFLRFFR